MCTLEEVLDSDLHNQFSFQLTLRLADKFLIARWKTHLAVVSALRDGGGGSTALLSLAVSA